LLLLCSAVSERHVQQRLVDVEFCRSLLAINPRSQLLPDNVSPAQWYDEAAQC